jgi:hypothetical protein
MLKMNEIDHRVLLLLGVIGFSAKGEAKPVLRDRPSEAAHGPQEKEKTGFGCRRDFRYSIELPDLSCAFCVLEAEASHL